MNALTTVTTDIVRQTDIAQANNHATIRNVARLYTVVINDLNNLDLYLSVKSSTTQSMYTCINLPVDLLI